MVRIETDNIVVTRGVATECLLTPGLQKGLNECFTKHLNGEWGNVNEEDREQNNESLKTHGFLMSCWNVCNLDIWIITDPGWATTTALLPEEY